MGKEGGKDRELRWKSSDEKGEDGGGKRTCVGEKCKRRRGNCMVA